MDNPNNLRIVCNDCQNKIKEFWQKTYYKLDLTGLECKFQFKVQVDDKPYVETIWVRVNKDYMDGTLYITLLNDSVIGIFIYGMETMANKEDILGHISKDHPFEKLEREAIAITSQHKHNVNQRI